VIVRKKFYEHVSNSEWLPRENCLNLPAHNHCNGNEETTYCQFYFNLNSMFKLQIFHKEKKLLQLTINVRKSHRQRQCTLQLVCGNRVLFVSVELHFTLCWQQHPK